MVPLLERVPYDILLDIAFLSAATARCRAPTELLSLRLTCKALFNYLDVRNSAHLYARLFRWHFDLSPMLLCSPTTTLNDATLADEYVLRQKLLARSRKSAWSTETLVLASDMSVALRMLLESCGANEDQLIASNFPKELFKLARVHLQPPIGHQQQSDLQLKSRDSGPTSRALKYLFVWLLSLTLSKTVIAKEPPAVRDEICRLLRAYIVTFPPTNAEVITFFDFQDKGPPSCHAAGKPCCPNGEVLSAHHHHHHLRHKTGCNYHLNAKRTLYPHHPIPLDWLNPAFAALNVLLTLKESYPLLTPPHLRESRVSPTSGPTLEDFRVFQRYQTPLFADGSDLGPEEHSCFSCSVRDTACARDGREGASCRLSAVASSLPRRCEEREKRQRRTGIHELNVLYGLAPSSPPYEAGAFSGLWQGSYLTQVNSIIGEENGDVSGFLNRRPMQAVFTEYQCFSPDVPLPSMDNAGELATLSTRPWETELVRHRYEMFGGVGTTCVVEERAAGVRDGPMSSSYDADSAPGTGTASRLSDVVQGQEAFVLQDRRVPLGFVEAEKLGIESSTTSTRVTREHDALTSGRRVVDTILFGETTPDHDLAWKGFRYVGRIHGDGKVFLKREPKNPSESYLGTWIFEGRLRFGKVLVGFWRALGSTDEQGARGIFSLTKVHASSLTTRSGSDGGRIARMPSSNAIPQRESAIRT